MSATVKKRKPSKKYELTNEIDHMTGLTLYRIRALKDFGDVKAGDLGGFIENESNLSHYGTCWVYDKARVFQNARVSGNAKVRSFFVDVCGNAKIYGNAIFEAIFMGGNARLYGNAHIKGAVVIEGNAKIYDNAYVTDHAHISDDAVICDDAHVGGNAKISGAAHICDDARVFDDAVVCGALISGDSYVHSAASLTADDHIWNEAYPEFGSEDDYYRHEYYDDFEDYYDADLESENDDDLECELEYEKEAA
ncbi:MULTISPECIES: hypothetical protein [unclassified Bartonella]|uniref:hypothetical protein n=1 Tax=unclassified Bartonella TaxID=2645622 RepID=UPI0035D121BC